MRVVLLMDRLGTGGTEQQMALLCRRWPREEAPIAVLCLDHQHVPEVELPPDVEIRFVGRSWKYDPMMFLNVVRQLRDLHCDVLIAPHRFSGLVAKLVGKSLLRVPTIVEIRGRTRVSSQRHFLYDVVDNQLLRLANAIVVNSEFVAGPLLRDSRIAGRVHVIRNGVDPRILGTEEPELDLRRHFDVPPTATLCMAVGRLAPVKNQRAAIDAISIMRGRGHDAWLFVVGDGPNRPELESYVNDIGLAEKIMFLGPLTPASALLPQADVFLHPSLWENCSNAILEAMAMGVPVVAFDVGGNAEALDGGLAGVLVDATTAEAMSRATLELVMNSDRRLTMTDDASARVRRMYSADDMTQAHLELARAVLSGSGRP